MYFCESWASYWYKKEYFLPYKYVRIGNIMIGNIMEHCRQIAWIYFEETKKKYQIFLRNEDQTCDTFFFPNAWPVRTEWANVGNLFSIYSFFLWRVMSNNSDVCKATIRVCLRISGFTTMYVWAISVKQQLEYVCTNKNIHIHIIQKQNKKNNNKIRYLTILPKCQELLGVWRIVPSLAVFFLERKRIARSHTKKPHLDLPDNNRAPRPECSQKQEPVKRVKFGDEGEGVKPQKTPSTWQKHKMPTGKERDQ